MNIQENLHKIKRLYWPVFVLVLSLIFVEMWKLGTLENSRVPLKVTNGNAALVAGAISPPENSEEVVGSKTGTKYYFPWCGTVKRIKPENLVHFASQEAARQAGYTPGGNCKGLN